MTTSFLLIKNVVVSVVTVVTALYSQWFYNFHGGDAVVTCGAKVVTCGDRHHIVAPLF